MARRGIERYVDGAPAQAYSTRTITAFWDELAELPITVEPPLSFWQAKTVGELCLQYGLTVYDGVYLDLAKRKGPPLATLDKDLVRAAPLEGVMLVTQPHGTVNDAQ